jgi:hypothetical protein
MKEIENKYQIMDNRLKRLKEQETKATKHRELAERKA